MKKFSLFLSAMLISMMSFAGTVTFDVAVDKSEIATADEVSLTKDGVTLHVSQGILGNGTNYRIYKGQWIDVSCEYGNITSVEFTCIASGTTKYGPGCFEYRGTAGAYTYDGSVGTWTGNEEKVTLYATSNQVRATKIVVTYESSDANFVSKPVIAGELDFADAAEVTITADEGMKIYYTLDGNDPTTASAEYTAPFEVTATTTVKAIAYNETTATASDVATVVFKQATKVTCAEAAEIAVTVSGNNVLTEEAYCVVGYVTDSTSGLSSGQQRFWVADTKDGGKVLHAYYCNVPYALSVGTKVQMVGKLTKYYTGQEDQPQMKNGDVTILPDDPKPVMFTVTATAENGTVEGAGEYAENAEATLTATAAEGYEFVNWTVDGAEVSTENPYTFVVTANVALVANFKEVVVEPATETVYFVNAQGWAKVNIYTWTPEVGGWPGVAMTKEAEQLAGYDVYSYTVEKGTAFGGMLFNCGGDECKTGDLVWEAGKYYVIDGWYTKEEAEAKLAAPVADIWTVAGAPASIFGTEWDPANAANNMALQEDGTYKWEKTDLTLAASNIQFKVAKNNSWGEAYPADNYNLAIAEAGIYTITITFNPATQEVVGTATKTGSAVVIPTIAIAGDMNGWNTTANEFVVSEDGLTASLTLPLEAKDYGFKMIIAGGWTSDGATITRENNTAVFTGANAGNSTLTADVAGEYTFTWTYATNTLVVTYPEKPAIEWIEMPLEISNLTTMEMPVEGVTYLQLTGRDDMNDADVMLFLNNYTGEEKAYEVNAESSFMTFGGMELTVMDGSITKSVDPELGDVFAGTVHASVEEDSAVLYVAFDLKMYALPPIAIELEDVEIVVNEESAIAFFNATWEGSPLQVEVSGFEEVEFKEYPECWLSIGDDVNWVDAAAGPAAIIIEDGVAMLEGEFTSFSTGKTYEVMLSGKLPVKEEPVVEPVYEENKLNPFAFGLESVLSEDASLLTVTYRLNNSNATSVDVVVYNGEEVVATVPGTTTIGVNVVEVATANLPTGVELTWGVVVKGTSVEAPTQEEKMYSMYCPHGLAIDKDPESEYFGRILVADAMNVVKDKAGYLGSGIGAGLHVFNPSFTTDSTVYTGGNDFTRILASNGYQPWRVKISEDGRIFVSSLDLNGVAVWEVSKDLQTWTPVIAGTNDATDYNIYDAEGNFIAGPNCSMDVIGSGEDLKLLLYSTNNKGIAFNQSGYRLDEYALGTATTWTGTPTNIINGGAYGLVHTNVEFIYDGEGGYWFGASRAGNAGQPNLVHINAAGEQDYYTEDAGLYGGDGVLVHNGMLFKGKARTSSTVGNFGVWTIGKDADGKVTLTEKWSVAANGIGRNLNEFAVDYAENLYVVGNSGEKIIAYALPYSGEVTTPAASQYAFTVGSAVEPVEMVGVVKRALQLGEATIVLTHESDGAAHLYKVVDGVAVAELSQEGVVPVDPENKGSYLAISDIAVTEDGKLVANNYVRCQFAGTAPEDGYKLGTSYYYIWDDLTGAPRVWFTSQATARSSHGDMGKTFAVKGTSTDAKVLVTAVHNNNRAVRMALYSIIDGVYEEPDIAGGTYNNDYYFNFGLHTTANYYKEATQGKEFYLLASPLADASWIIEGELSEPSEFLVPAEVGADYAANQEIAAGTLGNKYQGTSIVTVGEQVLMVAPYATAEGLLAGVKVLDITAGLDAATEVATADLDAAVEATAAATAVAVAENTLTITLVADATIYTLNVELESEPNYMLIEDEITNLVIDLESMAIIGGPSTMWQVEVFLGLAEDDNMDGQWSLSPESSVAIMGFDARLIDGYVYDIDVNAPAAKAVLYVEDSGFFYEIKLNMTSTPTEAIVVVVEDATVQIDTIPLFGDMVDYALKMTADWTYAEDGVTYPVLVEVPVYYPEATEPSEMTCTVTIGGMGDTDPWLGFGEGTLTITTVDGVVTAKGLVANPYTGVAFDVTVSGKLPVVEPEATWTVAGAPASIFGTEWDPSNTANDMVKQEDGTYKWEKTDLTLAASNIQFKVAKNNSWGEAYPADNYNLAIAEAGIYTITITFNPATQEVVGTATKTGSAVVIPTIAIAGDMNGWNTTANEFVVADDELTASLTLSLEAKNYGFKIIVAGGWTSEGTTVTRENNTVVFTGANGDNSTLVADVAGEYTFTWTYATSTLVVTYPVASSVDNVQVDAKAVKVIKNGMLIINRDGKEYNVQGAILK